MLATKKRLPKQRERTWTAESNKVVHQIRYYRILIQQTVGIRIHDEVLAKVRELGEISWYSDDVVLIKRRL